MQNHLRRAVLACLALTLVCSASFSSAAEPISPEEWREDLNALDQAIRTVHKDPFHTVSEADFSAMVESLHDAIPHRTDQEIIVAMASIVAAVHDGHTRLQGWYHQGDWGFERYPLTLYWYSDGLHVLQAHPDHADLVGAKVLEIGELSAEDAQALVETVAAADNAYGKRHGAPFFMISPQILQSLGILEEGSTTPYLLEKDGRTWRPQLEALSEGMPPRERGYIMESAGWADAKDPSQTPTPLWRRHPEKTFWFEYLPDSKLLYVQQNQVRNDPAETLESFYARVWDAFESNDVQNMVLDLRLNGGGNNYLNRPALTTMVRADASAQTFTIIGRQTFSACQNLVNELSRWTETVFVGEPTGERVNFYGDTRSTELPHSGLTVRASWLWWQNMDPRDTRDALYPDLSAELSSADYASNHDPAMTAVLEFEGLLTADELVQLLDSNGLGAVQDRLREAIHDPLYRYRDMESEINILGYRLVGEQRLDDAIGIFALNVEEFPDSWNVYDSLAESYEARGELNRALELYRKSLVLNPTSATGLDAVARLEGSLRSHSEKTP